MPQGALGLGCGLVLDPRLTVAPKSHQKAPLLILSPTWKGPHAFPRLGCSLFEGISSETDVVLLLAHSRFARLRADDVLSRVCLWHCDSGNLNLPSWIFFFANRHAPHRFFQKPRESTLFGTLQAASAPLVNLGRVFGWKWRNGLANPLCRLGAGGKAKLTQSTETREALGQAPGKNLNSLWTASVVQPYSHRTKIHQKLFYQKSFCF